MTVSPCLDMATLSVQGPTCGFVDHILQEFNTLLTRFRTYKIATPPQTKTSVNTTFRDWCRYSSFVHAVRGQPWHETDRATHLVEHSSVDFNEGDIDIYNRYINHVQRNRKTK